MRSFNSQLEAMVRELESECKEITGSVPERPKKKKKAKKGQHNQAGLSETGIREEVRKRLAQDSRPYRTKAMDVVSTFRERQLQMQDKQRDLQLTMDGPDWPKEDWPLTTADAQNVGDAEQKITQGIAELNTVINPLGGLARVYESDSEQSLEQLTLVSDMISGYIELIDRHVATVKKTQKGKNKKKKVSKSAAAHATGAQEPAAGGSLRDRLMSFGSQPAAGGGQQPFAWLREQGGAQGAPRAEGAMGPTTTGFGLPSSGGFGSLGTSPPQPGLAQTEPFGGPQVSMFGQAPQHNANVLGSMSSSLGQQGFGGGGQNAGLGSQASDFGSHGFGQRSGFGVQGANFGSQGAFADHRSQALPTLGSLDGARASQGAFGQASRTAGFGGLSGGLSQPFGSASPGFGSFGARREL